MSLGMVVGLSLHDIVLDGAQLPSPKGAQPPNYRPMFVVAGWTKMPIGMEVGLGPGDFVFDGDPATPEKGHIHRNPIFGPCLLWPNGCMDEDASW